MLKALTPLPIDEVIDEVKRELRAQGVIVLSAPPGSGKTTRVPLALLSEVSGRILMLQPRRMAARAVAEWMASLLGERVGERVGYAVRFEREIGERTRVEVLTEGLLTRRLRTDPELSGVSCVILDEFHERSIHADLALAMLMELRSAFRPDLKLIIMSATLDSEALCTRLNASSITTSGRQHPIEMRYDERLSSLSPCARAPAVILDLFEERRGTLLAFFPGRREIERAYAWLNERAPHLLITPLYGGLSLRDQARALDPRAPDRIILSTNIAETSLTIEGVTTVVDTGLVRVSRYDPKVGFTGLSLAPISTQSSTQRAGRAGRTRAGVCYRLWTEAEETQRALTVIPELHRADLGEVLLAVAEWSGDWRTFEWHDPPPTVHLHRAETTLEQIGALEGGRLTSLGVALASLPLSPHLGLSLLYGRALECLEEVALISALTSSTRDLLTLPFHHERGADPWLRVEAYRDARRGQFWPEVRRGAVQEVTATLSQLKRAVLKVSPQLLDTLPHLDRLSEQIHALSLRQRGALSFCLGTPHRVGQRREARSPRVLLALGGEVEMSPCLPLDQHEWIVSLSVRRGENKAPHRVSLACPIDLLWLKGGGDHSIELRFDEERGGVYEDRLERWGAIILERRQSPAPSDHIEAQALFTQTVIAHPQRWLKLDPKAIVWLSRLRWLTAQPELSAHLQSHSEEWASWRTLAERLSEPPSNPPSPDADPSPALNALIDALTEGITHTKALKKRDVLSYIIGFAPNSIARSIDRWAPERYTLPTGRSVTLTYEVGQPPVVEGMIQAFFGEAEHPTIAEGLVPLRLHLLAPNRRVAQITQDLSSFWAQVYPNVRKQLRGRYPKHHWPEDPLSMGPQRGTKRRPKPSS